MSYMKVAESKPWGGRGDNRRREKNELLWDYMKLCVWNFWKLGNTTEYDKSFIQLKKKSKSKVITRKESSQEKKFFSVSCIFYLYEMTPVH